MRDYVRHRIGTTVLRCTNLFLVFVRMDIRPARKMFGIPEPTRSPLLHAMRDILDQLFATSRSTRSSWHGATCGPRCGSGSTRRPRRAEAEGFRILLDGKPVRTPGAPPAGRAFARLRRPSPPNGRRSARSSTRHKCRSRGSPTSVIDGVADAPQAVAAEIGKFLALATFLLSRRRAAALVERQAPALGPGVAWARDALARALSWGRRDLGTQPAERLLPPAGRSRSEPGRLGALASITDLTGSGLLALALLHGRLTVEQAWEAAHSMRTGIWSIGAGTRWL